MAEVFLNVYYLNFAATDQSQYGQRCALRGAFHVGVEVHGKEYSYGVPERRVTGINVIEPRQHPTHIYKESISLGKTDKDDIDVEKWTLRSAKKWMGFNYSMPDKNSTHFANAMTDFLKVRGVPKNVSKFANDVATLFRQVMENGKTTGADNLLSLVEEFHTPIPHM